MQQKKIPMRKCMGCMEMFPKKELVRVVKTRVSDGEEESYEISLDLTGRKAGRGAYVCKNTDCLNKARKAKRFQRALDCQIPDEVFERMIVEMAADE